MVLQWRRPAQVQEAAEELRVVNDGAAAQLIRNEGFDPIRIKSWVESHPRDIDLTYARFGGVARILEAVKLLERNDPNDLRWGNERSFGSEAALRRHAWRILAMAAGVIDLSYYSPLMRGVVESFDGSSFIPFPSKRMVQATGIPEAWNDHLLVRDGSITYAEV